MRLAALVVCLALAGAVCGAEGNAWCPVTGRHVDPALAPVAVEVVGADGTRRTVPVRVADADAAAVLAKANAAQRALFVRAAERSMRVEGGRLVAIPEAAGGR